MACLTVSIVNYRTPHLVVQCVDSLKAFPPTRAALDIAVVDNGSDDGSLAVIAAAHPDIRLIDAGANLGFAAGNNLVMRGATADYLLLLNSDARVVDGTLDRLIDALDSNPRVGAVGARIVDARDGRDQDYPRRFPSLSAMIVRGLGGAELPASTDGTPVPMERLHGAGLMVKGELLRTVGLLDDGFFMYDEDVDWCVRMRDAGWALWLVPDARVVHHGGSSTGREPSGRRESIEASERALRLRHELRRSRYRLYRKHRSGAELLALKVATDLVLMLQCARAGATWLLRPSRRAALGAVMRANLRIVAMNPFAIDVARHDA